MNNKCAGTYKACRYECLVACFDGSTGKDAGLVMRDCVSKSLGCSYT